MKTFIAYFYYWTLATEDEHHELSVAAAANNAEEALEQFRQFLRKQYQNAKADGLEFMPSGATVYLHALYELSGLGTTPVVLGWTSVRSLQRAGDKAKRPYWIKTTAEDAEPLRQPNPTEKQITEEKSKREPFLIFPDLR